MTKKDIVILVTVVLLVGYGIYSTLRDVDADEPKDYSWVSRIAEERDENKLKLAEKVKERDAILKEIEYLETRNKAITCKLEKGDRDATCDEGLE